MSVLTCILVLGCVRSAVVGGRTDIHRVATWEAAPQLTEPRNMPPAPGLAGTTLRQVIHLSIGGSGLRVRLSNEFGDGPLRIGSAHIARSRGADTIDVESDRTLTFGGREAIDVPVGGAVYSDDVEAAVAPLENVTVSLFMTAVPAALTGHPGSRTTSFVLAGNSAASRTLPGATRVEHWYVLKGLDVHAPSDAAAVVVLGNSIADGRGSGTDKNNRWPDNLAQRLHDDERSAHVAVLNAGIGGNTILRGGLGPTALQRFDRDVLQQPGVRWLIVSEGVNDIGGSRGADGAAAVARELIGAYQALIARAKEQHVTVYGATILPFDGSQYGSPEHEAARQTVNTWIRESGAFARVIDLDAVMRDPAAPSHLKRDVDGGDHLHPNELGYRVMADAIDPSLFTPTAHEP